jgi:hypothetical protein
MAVDVPTITGQLLGRLTTDLAGAAVRAALGLGPPATATKADCIVHGDKLKQYVDGLPMPARPLIAYRWGPIGGRAFEMRPVLLNLWLYDDADPTQRYSRITALLPLVQALYYPPDCIPFGRTEAANVGQEYPDPVLGLLARTLQITFTTRG